MIHTENGKYMKRITMILAVAAHFHYFGARAGLPEFKF